MKPEKRIKPRLIKGWIINKSDIPTRYNLRWAGNKHLPAKYRVKRIVIVGWDRVKDFLNQQ